MPEDEEVETTTEDEATTEVDTDTQETEPDPTEGLKKALKAEHLARREAERKARDLEAEKENAGKEPAEQALAQARREAAAEATRAADSRILRSEIRAAAKGRLADAGDALVYLNLDEFEVGDDGDIDSEAIEDAIADLLTRKPYLAADTGEKFRGGADQGARGKQTTPSQVSKAELESMSPAEINKARREGRLSKILGTS